LSQSPPEAANPFPPDAAVLVAIVDSAIWSKADGLLLSDSAGKAAIPLPTDAVEKVLERPV